MTDLLQSIALASLATSSVLHTLALRRQRRHIEHQQRVIEALISKLRELHGLKP